MAVWKVSQALNLLRLHSSNSNLLPRICSVLSFQRCQSVYQPPCRALSCSLRLRVGANVDEETPTKPKKKKTLEIPKITLYHPDNTMTITDLENAQKLAKRRGWKLVKADEVDTKSHRDIYRLMTSADLTKDDDVEKEAKTKTKGLKSTKIFYTQSTIAKRDFLIKIKNIVKVLNKKHKVKLVISDAGGNMDYLFTILKSEIKDCENMNIVKTSNASTIYITPSLKDEATPLNEMENIDKP